MKSDDTKPAVLSAARLALDAFEAAPTGSTIQDDAAYDAARALGPVLAHLDALTAGEVPASLYGDLNWAAKSDGEARSREMVAAAYVRGRAAGRAEGEAERALLREALATSTAELAEARAELDVNRANAGTTVGTVDAVRYRIEQARVEGAREERNATIDDMLAISRDAHPSAQTAVCEAMQALNERIQRRARGAGGAG
mgnify:CR=1 FL=1